MQFYNNVLKYVCVKGLPEGKFVPFTKQQTGTDVRGIVVLIFFWRPVAGCKIVGLGPVTILIVVLEVGVVITEVGVLVSVINLVVAIGEVVNGNVVSSVVVNSVVFGGPVVSLVGVVVTSGTIVVALTTFLVVSVVSSCDVVVSLG